MINQEKIKEGVRLILEGIGEDLNREGLRETPDRIARMYEEVFSGMEELPGQHLAKRFPVEDDHIILEKDITFFSMCEHHLLPFFGKVHLAYLPKGEVAGLSKLARLVEVFAKRPQLQERMSAQIADALMECLKPRGVMVMVEAEHMCMTMRGIKKPGSKTVTCVTRGCFTDEPRLQDDFYRMLGR
ncbi:MAG: GTP cyclohydrolase I FolE [Lachnospiraceae bacterium]|nr:GTP cyclohydrolase I FolE [Lachnospiraceae bacterium]